MSIKIKAAQGKKFKTWVDGEQGFRFSPDNIILVPRASFQINEQCPDTYKQIINECLVRGWLKPVAHQPIEEHFLEELSK